jgi:hypothetical protein
MDLTEANRARLASFRNSAHIAGVRRLGTLDSTCCVICAALDGSRWDLDGAPLPGTTVRFQMPLLHENCRRDSI